MPKESTKKSFQKQKVLLYGSTGLAGAKILQLLRYKFKIVATPHYQLDLNSKKTILSHLEDVLPNQIIYAAGLTKVDEAEANPIKAFNLNHQIPMFITKHAAKLKIPFHYLSTDAVFNGEKTESPYKETDNPNPISVYGRSKLKGEIAALSASGLNSVIRTELLYTSYYPHKKDFARVAYESLKRQEKFAGVINQVITPTFIDDLVYAVSIILEKKATGIYHIASTDFTTNYGFLLKLAGVFNLNKNLIEKVSFEEFFVGKRAKRARNCWLDTQKFRKKFKNHGLREIDASLEDFKKQLFKVESLPIDL